MAGLLISKKSLCYLFDCTYKNGTHNCRSLRNKIMTDKVLTKIDVTKSEYKRIKTFTRLQSIKIRDILLLDKEEVEFLTELNK